MTANISSDINDTSKVVKLIAEAKKMQIIITAPDINSSYADFTIADDNTIQYGLAAIKNVGYKVAELIAQHRNNNGLYTSIFDLCLIDNTIINKKVIESLILVGACNSLQEQQSQLYESIDIVLDFANKYHKNKNSNQENLFNSSTIAETKFPTLKKNDEWSQDIKTKHEKELLGFYLSFNPLEKHEKDLNEISTIDKNGINIYKSELGQLGGLISDINLRYDKLPVAEIFHDCSEMLSHHHQIHLGFRRI